MNEVERSEVCQSLSLLNGQCMAIDLTIWMLCPSTVLSTCSVHRFGTSQDWHGFDEMDWNNEGRGNGSGIPIP